MKRSHGLTVAMVVLLAIAAIVFVTISGKKSSVALGAKPTVKSWEIPHQANMRAWLETISPQDAKTLNSTGGVIFSYEKLKTLDPVHAGMVDKYVEDWRSAELQREQHGQQSNQLPPDIAAAIARHNAFFTTPQSPETIAFYATDGPGAYKFEIAFKDNQILGDLPLSNRL